MRLAKTVIVVLLCLAAAGAAFSAGYAACLIFGAPNLPQKAGPQTVEIVMPKTGEPASADEEGAFRVFWEAWRLLETNFMGELPTPQKMTYAAIRGVLGELKDSHTVLIEPAQRQLEKDEHRGRFGGIGVWLYQREDDRQFVLTPIEGGPAARAGVREGDILARVNDTVIDPAKLTRDDVVSMVRGPVGVEVRLGLRREGYADEIAVAIVREEFETPSVEWRMLDERDPTLGYLRIVQFTERTGHEVRQAVVDLKERGMRKLVLDLRDNPGGLLEAALDVSSAFLDGGVIMYERQRDGTEQTYSVRPGGVAQDVPLAVLINSGSASGAEIVAGALHDRGRCILVGERTYGKGSVQLVFDLSDGASLHVTVARWLTPARQQIDGVGVQPDQQVTISKEDREQGRDSQLNAAAAVLKTKR